MTSAIKKYLTAREIDELIGEIHFDDSFIPMSQDTYNETLILEAIKATGKTAELAMAAVNMACVGYGSKKFGLFKHKAAVIDIATLLENSGVKIGLGKDAKISEKDLTPQRICRAFRNHVRSYIVDKKFETYLFRKYSNHDVRFANICFRGAEYLDDLKKEECDFLLALYAKLDADRGINISERIKRVFQAKGYISRTLNI